MRVLCCHISYPVGIFDLFRSSSATAAPAEPAPVSSPALRQAIAAEREKRSAGVEFSTESIDTGLLARLGWGGGSVAGVAVTQHTAMSLSAVWASVNAISQDIAGLPVQMIRQEGNTIEQVSGRQVTRLLNLQASPLQNSFHFRQSTMALLLLRGNCYAIIQRDSRQEPVQLDWKHPDETEVRKSGGRLYYKFSGDPKTYQDYEVLHFRGLSLDGVMGVSVLHWHRETFGKGLASRRAALKFYENGAKPNLALETDKLLSEKGAVNLAASFQRIYGGVDNAGKPLILEEGLKARPLSLTPADAQYVQDAELTVADVARIFRMPLHKIGDLSRATNNNIEQQSLDYVGDTLMPWLVNLEQELRIKLLRTSEVENTKFKHNVTALLRADATARANYYAKMTDIGAYTINDVLALEDRNGIGEDGDLRFVQVNRQTLAQAKAGKQPTTSTTPDNEAQPAA